MTTIRIGTRRSQLAMWQANHVRDALCKVHPDLEVEIVGITTQGDRTLAVSYTHLTLPTILLV